ncbi:MAG: mechanosensitive ion channel [Bacteroidetes bacterium]|nr:mechanosensitive ion channel [Bacteroidota bacterium]
MKRILFAVFCLFITLCSLAQQHPPHRPHNDSLRHPADSTRPHADSARHRMDSTQRRRFDMSVFSDSNTLTRSDYLFALERMFQTLNKVPVVTASLAPVADISDELNESDSALSIIKERVTQSDRTLNIRNLQMFRSLLTELKLTTTGYSEQMTKYDETLDKLKKEILDLRKDSTLRGLFRDSAMRNSMATQLQQLRNKWKITDSLVRADTKTINDVRAHAAANLLTINELSYQTDALLKTVGSRAFSKERRYLWEPRNPNAAARSAEGFKKAISSEQKMARYYFANSREKRALLWIIGILFFYWVFYNFRTLRRAGRLDSLDKFSFRYLSRYPVAVSLVFMLSLAPLFDIHAPAIYIESVQFISMIVLTILFWKRLPRTFLLAWCLFVVLFLLLSSTRILGIPVSLQRWWMLIINSASVVFGLFMLLRLRKWVKKQRVVLSAVSIYIFFNLLAVFFNLFGRVTLSQIFGATANYAFAQAVGLSVFIQALIEAFMLQIQSSRIRKRYPDHFDYAPIAKGVGRFATILSVLLWLLVFTTNLNIYGALSDTIVDFLTQPRSIGSFGFTLSGTLMFLGIIWIANFLQKHIAFFFGDVGDDAAFDNKGQRSRLLVTRLILLVLGFMLAVAASGLSIDRVTVILGALGVGIGLGLQNIVNNFVSGIILIFDRPLRLGDTVEIGDKKGRVKEIGVRSSTLLTPEGAEVIIPNGDILSHNIVNWTLSNNHIRIELTFLLARPYSRETVQQLVLDIMRHNTHTLQGREPQLLFSTASAKSDKLKIYFWCRDISLTELAGYEIEAAIRHGLEEKGIKEE